MENNNQHPYENQNLHIDPDALEQYYTLSKEQPLSPEDGFCFDPKFADAEGYREIINLSEGFQILLGDIKCYKEDYIIMRSDTALKIHFRLEGASGLEVNNANKQQITQHTMGVLLLPDGITNQEHYLAGEREKSVTLICEPRFIKNHFKVLADQLPDPLKQYTSEGLSTIYAEIFPARIDMVSAANAVFDTELIGKLRKIFIHAKAFELLVLSLELIIEIESKKHLVDKCLSKKDIDRLQKARKILQDNFITPPTIKELARKIGVNEAKLMNGFKQLFSQTIFDYTQNLRMDKAKYLLEKTELSITEVALTVGYDYSSNFTNAFKRCFGVTPSYARGSYQKNRK